MLIFFFIWLIVMSTVIPITIATYKFRCKELEFDKERYRDKQAELLYKRLELGD